MSQTRHLAIARLSNAERGEVLRILAAASPSTFDQAMAMIEDDDQEADDG